MNEEPIYTYVRGEGWIVTTAPLPYLFIDNTLQKWLVYERRPKPGEKWTATNHKTKTTHEVLNEWDYVNQMHLVGVWAKHTPVNYDRYFVFVPA